MIGRAALVWLLLLALAVANGALRAAVLIPRLGMARAHVVSTILLSAVILGVTAWAIRWIAPASIREAWLVGIGWTLATATFELLAGRLSGRSWSEVLGDYDLASGRIWPLVLLTTLLAPVWAQRRIPGSGDDS
jgi:hypothetical protein